MRYSSALCFQTATAFGYSVIYLPDFSGTFEKPYFIFLSPAMADQYREQEVEVVGEGAPAMGAAGTAQAAGMEAELGGMGEPPIPAPAGQEEQTQAGPHRGVSPQEGALLPGCLEMVGELLHHLDLDSDHLRLTRFHSLGP